MNVGVEIIWMVTRCIRKVRVRNGTGAVANTRQKRRFGNSLAHMFLLTFVHQCVNTEEFLYSNLINCNFMKPR